MVHRLAIAMVVLLVGAGVVGLYGNALGQAGKYRPAETSKIPLRLTGDESTYQVLHFTFNTGDDDLRDDTNVRANFIFPDNSTDSCLLHGHDVSGADSQLTWANNSVHVGAPCHLNTPRTVQELKRIRIDITTEQSGGFFKSPDNWDIDAVLVYASNLAGSGGASVLCVKGHPLLFRTTADHPTVTVSEFQNPCSPWTPSGGIAGP